MNIVCNHDLSQYPSGLKPRPAPMLGPITQRTFQPPNVSHRAHAKDIPPLVQASLHCELPQLTIQNKHGENIQAPYFPHRVRAKKIGEILQTQFIQDRQRRKENAIEEIKRDEEKLRKKKLIEEDIRQNDN
jgi:hypothetical protein